MAVPSTGRVKWTDELKTAVCLLCDLGLPRQDRLAVINGLDREHFAECGLPHGIAMNRLENAYRKLKRCPPAAGDTQLLDTIKAAVRRLSDGGKKARLAPVAAARSSKKRGSEALDDSLYHQTTSKKRLVTGIVVTPVTPPKKQMATAIVVIPATPPTESRISRNPSLYWTPSTPRTPRSKRADLFLHKLPIGREILLTPEELEANESPWVPLTESAAHPPLGALLYRYFDPATSQSPMTDAGDFIARRFAHLPNLAPPQLPAVSDLAFPWHDVLMHLDRQKAVPSPWISVSNYLPWILRLAMRQQRKGAGGRIAVIRAADLPEHGTYHSAPFFQDFRRRHWLSPQNLRYAGSHEWLVYHKIPANAIIGTFDVADMVQMCANVTSIDTIVRPSTLQKTGDFRTKIREELISDWIHLVPETIRAMAKFLHTIGLTADCSAGEIGGAIGDIASSWLRASRGSTGLGRSVSYLCRRLHWEQKHGRARVSRIVKARLAFLESIRWGLGTYNTRHSVGNVRQMQGKAARLGLDTATTGLRDDLMQALDTLNACDATQRQLLIDADQAATAQDGVLTPNSSPLAARFRPATPV